MRPQAAALAVLGLWAALSPADARAADDAAMGRRLQEALRAQRGEVHRCYGTALHADPRLQGELLVRLVMAEEGRVAQAEVVKDQTGSAVLVSCLRQMMQTWRLPQLEAAAGDEVVFPLYFRPDEAERPDEAGPRAQVQRAQEAERAAGAGGVEGLDYLGGLAALRTVAPGRVWTLDSAGAQGTGSLLFVVAGQARPRMTQASLRDLGPGDGVLVPAGADELRLQSIGVAPLKVLRLKQGGGSGRAVVLRGATAPWLAIPGVDGAPPGQVRILADAVTLGAAPAASLAELSFPAGTRVAVHQHESDELIYVQSGGGVMTVGAAGAAREVLVSPGDVVHIPRGVPHGLRVNARLSAVQSYTPAGPEARFRRAAATPRPAPPQDRKP